MDFRHTFVIGASWDKDELIELIKFWGQKIKGQGHIAAGASSTLRCCGVQHSSSSTV